MLMCSIAWATSASNASRADSAIRSVSPSRRRHVNWRRVSTFVERRVELGGEDHQPADQDEGEQQRGCDSERAVGIRAALDQAGRHVDVEGTDEEETDSEQH